MSEEKAIEDGGPAFARAGFEYQQEEGGAVALSNDAQTGMTFRMYAAAKAMQGLLSCQDFVNETAKVAGSREGVRLQIAAWSVAQADSLIAALAKPEAKS